MRFVVFWIREYHKKIPRLFEIRDWNTICYICLKSIIMKKIKIISLLLLFVGAIAFSSCASNKKCNGSRGIKTPMGNM